MSETSIRNDHARRSVAVPDSFVDGSRYRLGVKCDQPQATFSLGQKGPGGQRLASVYLTAEGAFLALDLDARTITVVSGGDSLQAVSYDIDAEAMQGAEIQVGNAFSVVFSYDNKQFVDETPVVHAILATTGPQYPNLSDRLEVDDSVANFAKSVETARALGRFGRASRAPRTAQELKPLPSSAEQGVQLKEDQLPEAIQMTDPLTRTTFVGRVWERPGDTTSVRELVEAGYRLAMVEFVGGEKAILLPNFRGGLGIEIRMHDQDRKRILDASAMDIKIGPGERLNTTAISSFEGDRTKGGPFASPAMKYVAALGEGVEVGVDPGYRNMDFLMEFRGGKSREDFTLVS